MTFLKNTAYYPYYLLGMFILNLCAFWPGILTSDSMTQYQIALSQSYSDHHPALMSFVWRQFNKVYEGPGGMLFFHLSLLYGSCFLFFKTRQFNSEEQQRVT